jgi:hypothetical protein
MTHHLARSADDRSSCVDELPRFRCGSLPSGMSSQTHVLEHETLPLPLESKCHPFIHSRPADRIPALSDNLNSSTAQPMDGHVEGDG